MTFILGLTGTIGMGKSTTAGLFRELGIPVHDADDAVHQIYREEGVPIVGAAFPETVKDGVIDRESLGQAVWNDPQAMGLLESLVHPLVRRREEMFLQQSRSRGAGLAVLDIPLLLETGGETRCDAVLVVTADPEIQRARVLARPGMTQDKLAMIAERQMPDAKKRLKAHFILDTGRGLTSARAQAWSIVACLAGRPGRGDKKAHA